MRLKGKTALVTAAGQGIGQAAALAMAAEGALVYATDVNAELLKSYQGVANVHTAVLNVLDKQAIAAQVASMDRIDILFNCAGFVHNGNIEQAKDEEWEFAFNLNVRSMMRTMQAFLPGMLERRAGRIITFASQLALTGQEEEAAYCASKGAVISMTKALAREAAPAGVLVNCVAPGFIETDMTASLPEDQQKALLGQIPLGHLGKPSDIAHAVAYLAGAHASYVTGQELHVNGGMHM